MGRKKVEGITLIAYLDSMLPNAFDVLNTLPCAYALHDKDTKKDGALKKPHYHIVLQGRFKQSQIKEIKRLCGLSDMQPYQPILDFKGILDYLTHNTDDCRRKKKYIYDTSIIHYSDTWEDVEIEDNSNISVEIVSYIFENGISEFSDLVMNFIDKEEYFNEIKGSNNFYKNIINSMRYSEIKALSKEKERLVSECKGLHNEILKQFEFSDTNPFERKCNDENDVL